MSPTWSRPCWSIIPPWRMRAITSSPFSIRNVTPWQNNRSPKLEVKTLQAHSESDQSVSMTFIYQFTILECAWSAHRKQWMQSYQMLSSHFADAHHADGISWCTIDGRLHESTRARGRSLTRLRGHRVMRFQQRLIIKSTACQSLIRLFIILIWFDRLAGLQRCTWKCGWLSMCDSSAAVLLRCVKGLSSLRMSCTSSTLLSLTASSRVSSRLSAL